MQAVLRRVPTADDLQRNRGKIAGFAAGVVATLVLSVFSEVLYTGNGLSEEPQPVQMVYPNL